MGLKALPCRPSVPLLITNSQIAADGTQIAFHSVLMFFFVTQVRNCEDESRILNDLHRITYYAANHGIAVESVKYWYVASRKVDKVMQRDSGEVK
ncbi:hypothetical protein T01_4052, partial [Trichinella spiralis]